MEESVGHITAIGSVTMESGRLIGNSLKTIYSRITTLKASEEILSSVGVAIKQIGEDGVEVVRPVNDILGDLAARWDTISASQQQNISVTVAGRYQLSRFLALMNNYDTALDATSTAVYSQGSAMRENAEYMKSFEARVNQLKNGWVELTDAIGNAVMKSAMMEVLRGLTSLAQVAVRVTDAIGVLPVLFGAVVAVLLKMNMFNGLKARIITAMTGIGVAFLSTNAKANVLSRGFAFLGNAGRMSMASLTASARTMAATVAASLRAAQVAVRGFTVAFQSMLASTGIGIAFVALGVAIEKLLKLYNEKKEKQQELIKLNDKMVDSYRSHRDGMQGVISRYEELSEKTNRTTEEEREYLGIQKQLAEQIPTTVSYIDANGKAHMKTTEQIKREVEAVKELSIQEAKLTNAKFQENMEKKSKSYMKIVENIEELNKKQKELEANDGKNAWTNGHFGTDNMWDALLSTDPYLDNKVHIEQNKVDVMMAESEKTSAIQKTLQAIQEQTASYFEAGNKMSAIGDSQQAMIEKFIGLNEQMLRSADTPEKFEQAYKDLFEIGVKVGDVFVEAYDIMAKDVGDDPLKLQELQKNLGEVAKSVPESFMMLEDEFGKPIKSIEEVEKGLKEIVNVSQHVSKGSGDWDGLTKRLEEAGLSADQAQGFLKDLANEHSNAELKAIAQAQGVDGLSESIESLNEQAMEAIDLTQKLFGYSGTELEGMKSHLQMMHLLRDTMGEAAKETDDYKDSQMALSDFLGVTTEELAKNESKYYDIIEALSAVDLTAYDPSTSWKGFIDSQEIDDNMKSLLKSWDGTKNILTGEKIEIVESNEDIKVSVEEIKDVFEKDVKTENGVAGAVKDLKKETEDDGWVLNFKKQMEDVMGITEDGKGGGFGNWLYNFIPPTLKKDINKAAVDIQNFFDDLPNMTSSFLKMTDNALGNFPSKTAKIFEAGGKAFGEWFSDLGGEAEKGIGDLGNSMSEWWKKLPTSSNEQFDAYYVSIKKWFKETGKSLISGLSNWGESISDFFSDDSSVNWEASLNNWSTAIGDWIGGLPERFTGQWSDWGTSISTWYSEETSSIATAIEEWWEPIGDWFSDLPSRTLEKLYEWGMAIYTWFKEQDKENREFYSEWSESMLEFFDGMPAKIANKLAEWKETISTWFSEKTSTFVDGFTEWWSETVVWFNELPERFATEMAKILQPIAEWFTTNDGTFVTGLTQWATKMFEWFTDIPSKIKEQLDEWAKAINDWFVSFGSEDDFGRKTEPVGKDIVEGIKKGYEDNEDDILTMVSQTILKLPGYVIAAGGILLFGIGREIIRFIMNGFRSDENGTVGDAVSAFFDILDLTISPYVSDFFDIGGKMLSNMAAGFISKKQEFEDKWNTMKTIAVTAMETMATQVSQKASELPNKIGLALKAASVGVRFGIAAIANEMASGIESGINNVINGANKVLGFFGVATIENVSVPRMQTGASRSSGGGGRTVRAAYAKGTINGTHQGGEALVGEEGQELAHIPNKGLTLLGKNGAEIVDLPKGSSVLPHKQTQEMLSTYHFPAYANGVGDYFNGMMGLGKFAVKKGYNEVKGSIGELYEKYSDTPRKIIESVLNSNPWFNPMSGGSGSLIGGAFKKVKEGGMDYVTNQIKDFFGVEGGGVASFGGLTKTSNFGSRIHPITGKRAFHAGVDYAGALNTAIKAQVGGMVTQSGASGTGFGTMVKIKNGIYEYIYAHLNRALAKRGTMVKAGSLIGLLGSTGDSTGPHLHYEVRKNGKAVKPNIQGFEVGGKVKKEQIIRVGEGNKEEMIIPLEQHKERAVSLWKEAGERLGQFEYFAKGGKVGTPAKAKTSSSSSQTYKVKSGDTLSQIAQTFKTTVKALMDLNKGIKNANQIYVGQSIKLANASKGSTSKKPTAKKGFSLPLSAEQSASKWKNAIALAESKMSQITMHSDKYRKSLEDVLLFQQRGLSFDKVVLDNLKKRQQLLLDEISKISGIKRSELQQEKYDRWKQEYESNIETIQSMNVEIQNSVNAIKEKTKEIFMSMVEEIKIAYDKIVTNITDKLNKIDFKTSVFELTDPDNLKLQIDLELERLKELKNLKYHYNIERAKIEQKLLEAVRLYGSQSDVAQEIKNTLRETEASVNETILKILESEKSLRDMRASVADDSIDMLKDFYSRQKEMAENAKEHEIEQAKKAHDAKMKIYDKEIEKINDIYDAKIKSLDDEVSEDDYNEQLAEKNAEKVALLNKIALLSRNDDPESRKKLAELQEELKDKQKDIDNFMKNRQRDLLKEQLAEQRDNQIEAIELEKEKQEAAYDSLVERLEREKESISAHYDAIINDEQRWAKVRDDMMKGNFTSLENELGIMQGSITDKNSSIFASLASDFEAYMTKVRQQIADLKNINVGTDTSYNDAIDQKNSDGSDKLRGRLTTGLFQKKKTADELNEIIKKGHSPQSSKVVAMDGGYRIIADFESVERAKKVLEYQKKKGNLGTGYVTAFDTGGYTGDWSGDEGKLALLHKKEIVLNQGQTKDILNVAKIAERIKDFVPNLNMNSLSKQMALAGGNTTITNEYNLNVTIENMNGDKKQAKSVTEEMMNGLRKLGRKGRG